MSVSEDHDAQNRGAFSLHVVMALHNMDTLILTVIVYFYTAPVAQNLRYWWWFMKQRVFGLIEVLFCHLSGGAADN
jgi:hypothetical protein